MKIFAHRGASGSFPENTLLAFDKAIREKAEGIEFDVQYHSSGQLVILHDFTLEKTTDGHGPINGYSLTELQQLDAGQGEIIPTLAQALTLIKGKCLVNIELKSRDSNEQTMNAIIDALIKTLTEAINHHQFTWTDFVVSSFNHPLLQKIKHTIPSLPIGVLLASCPITYAKCAQNLSAYSVHPSIDSINEAFVKDAHQRNLKVWVYTVDKPIDIDYCQAINVDGIFTNFPIKTREYLTLK